MTDKQKAGRIVLSAQSVYKDFYLPHEKSNSLKGAVVNIFKSKDKEVDTQHALRGVSFDIHEGEFFGILGRNGSGKSTLLKILAEIYQPTKGSVSHIGKLVPFIELGVGFNPELTGRENVYLNGALLGFSRKEIDDRYDEIVEFAELEEFMDQKLKNYSSGMQVRLAFSVATRAEADILLVDEVLAVGDADFQRKCYDFFKSLKKSGKTVVFVTHDMGAVREYCERAVLIKDGVVAHQGDANTIADEYLKLFNTNTRSDEVETSRWGNGQVKIVDFHVETTDLEVSITATIQASKKGADNCIFGYRFNDAEGTLVAGGSTLNAKNGSRLSLKPNQIKNLTFSMPNVLGSGSFGVSATVRLGDGVTVCDSWENIEVIGIVKSESHYPVIMPASLEIKG